MREVGKVVHVALGGTFEVLHRGHRALLAKAFAIGDSVIIGLTSDSMASAARGRRVSPYPQREVALRAYLDRRYPARDFVIERIDDRFGPAARLEDLDVLVVSENTHATGVELNEGRARRGLEPLQLVTVRHVLAEDGRPISSTRVLAGEIDGEGRLSS